MNRLWLACALLATLAVSGVASGNRISDVRATVHNLSNVATGTTPSGGTIAARNVMAKPNDQGGTDQVCVFCHTPHGASQQDLEGSTLRTANWTPALWNRKIPQGSSYTGYTSATSSSLDAAAIQAGFNGQPGGSSKLCLSCHDGTLAIGSVNVWNGSSFNVTSEVIQMTGTRATDDKTMPIGMGTSTGFTRNLGTTLSNDHPISVTYDETLANRDGELRVLDSNQRYGTTIGIKAGSYKPKLPLEKTGAAGAGQVQCATCHDPHIREANAAAVDYANPKFLRLNRFQAVQPTGSFSETDDIICLACHDKAGKSWAYSAHANDDVATQTYQNTANSAQLRQFPSALPVWKASCLNCHDAHAVTGSRRLLREGTNAGDTTIPKPGGAGTSATEETCYQCHDGTTTVLNSVATVPNIKTDFTTASNTRMPIAKVPENHDIGGVFDDSATGGTRADCDTTTNKCGKDFLESRTRLGDRHAECTDCHNPHRVIKYKDGLPGDLANLTFNNSGNSASGTHQHADTSDYTHTNLISGVLRGAWGVEPIYAAASNPTSFHTQPSSYEVKRGDPGTSNINTVGSTYVTREYQICLKCHSDYGYSDNNTYPVGNRPNLGSPGTASGTNYVTQYTNQAKEFQPASGHTGEPQGRTGSGAGSAYEGGTQYNHRSWHPVIAATGRGTAERGIDSGNPWRAPWNSTVATVSQLGVQTMYCSDCHGSTTAATTVRPLNTAGTATEAGEDGKPWGPHGSSSNFILKGPWSTLTGSGNTNDLCFRCHNPTTYVSASESGNGSAGTTGFSGPRADNLHGLHANRVSSNKLKCVWCHVAVPHGWKNKALLVNLNDIGPEAGHTGSKEVAIPNGGTANAYNKGPYYLNAKLKVLTFARSGSWAEGNCGSSGKTGMNLITRTGTSGTTTADAGDSATNQPGTTNYNSTGKDWMTNTCSTAP